MQHTEPLAQFFHLRSSWKTQQLSFETTSPDSPWHYLRRLVSCVPHRDHSVQVMKLCLKISAPHWSFGVYWIKACLTVHCIHLIQSQRSLSKFHALPPVENREFRHSEKAARITIQLITISLSSSDIFPTITGLIREDVKWHTVSLTNTGDVLGLSTNHCRLTCCNNSWDEEQAN